MTPLHRTVTVVMVAAGLSLCGAATVPPVQAQSDDKKFTDEVAALGIPFAPDEDLPAIGHGVCDMLNGGLAGNPNPVPVVRGVVQKLEISGMTKEQAVGLMRVSVAVYCPQHGRYMGR
jgi:Protein of unknown function (DUF732)